MVCSAASAAVMDRRVSGVDGCRKLRRSLGDEQPTQNWYGQGESDCLIKTKHCDGRKAMLTQCDFCPGSECQSEEIQPSAGKRRE